MLRGFFKLAVACAVLMAFIGVASKEIIDKPKEGYVCSAAVSSIQNSLDCINLPYCRMTASELKTFRELLKTRRHQCGATPHIQLDELTREL